MGIIIGCAVHDATGYVLLLVHGVHYIYHKNRLPSQESEIVQSRSIIGKSFYCKGKHCFWFCKKCVRLIFVPFRNFAA